MESTARAWLALMVAMAGASAVAQEPVPGPPQPAMVFFDWGKDALRRDDSATLDKVAEAWRASPSARLRLAGHTDRSGSAAFNRRAGLDRARMIRAELEKRGVPRNAMIVTSLGEEQPLVATEDGVREVQNRRVEILLTE